MKRTMGIPYLGPSAPGAGPGSASSWVGRRKRREQWVERGWEPDMRVEGRKERLLPDPIPHSAT